MQMGNPFASVSATGPAPHKNSRKRKRKSGAKDTIERTPLTTCETTIPAADCEGGEEPDYKRAEMQNALQANGDLPRKSPRSASQSNPFNSDASLEYSSIPGTPENTTSDGVMISPSILSEDSDEKLHCCSDTNNVGDGKDNEGDVEKASSLCKSEADGYSVAATSLLECDSVAKLRNVILFRGAEFVGLYHLMKERLSSLCLRFHSYLTFSPWEAKKATQLIHARMLQVMAVSDTSITMTRIMAKNEELMGRCREQLYDVWKRAVGCVLALWGDVSEVLSFDAIPIILCHLLNTSANFLSYLLGVLSRNKGKWSIQKAHHSLTSTISSKTNPYRPNFYCISNCLEFPSECVKSGVNVVSETVSNVVSLCDQVGPIVSWVEKSIANSSYSDMVAFNFLSKKENLQQSQPQTADPKTVLALACDTWVACHSRPTHVLVREFQSTLKNRLQVVLGVVVQSGEH